MMSISMKELDQLKSLLAEVADLRHAGDLLEWDERVCMPNGGASVHGEMLATLRRLACDAELIPAVLGSRSEPLDVGRTRRLVTPAIWAALVIRDRHCAFPGCTRPPVMCHAHHIHHWADGGTTSLDNLVMLCGHHHRVIHHSPWKVRINPHDQKPEFQPPPKPGTETHWIRHRPRLE